MSSDGFFGEKMTFSPKFGPNLKKIKNQSPGLMSEYGVF